MGCQRKGAAVGDRFYGGFGILRPLTVERPWQASESFFTEDLADSGRNKADAAILQDFADLINRVVFLPQLDDLVLGSGLPGSGRRPSARRGKETGIGLAMELMTEHPEGPWGYPNSAATTLEGLSSTK
jgi:hypothetical protein